MQQDFFRPPHILLYPDQCHGLDELVLQSREIVSKAILDHNPYAVVLMLSGGDDSITALQVAIMLGVRIDVIIHGVTGTGLPAVKFFCREVANKHKIKFIEADAGNAFEEYVDRKGFFGVGDTAHEYSYHILKTNPFDRAISKYLRKGVRGRKILLLNGVRIEESEKREKVYGDNPYKWQGNNLWVNIIHFWTKDDCMELIAAEGVERSPVAIALGRSGECNCGTMQNEASRIACSSFDPNWGEWMNNLRKHIIRKHGWDINQNPPRKLIENRSTIGTDFMPMCVGCKAQNIQQLQIDI